LHGAKQMLGKGALAWGQDLGILRGGSAFG